MYERHIKGIYSAIVAFISETTFSRREEPSADLQWLREACIHLVEAVKDTRQLQENLIEYVGSDIPKMRGLYNRIRAQVGMIVRDLEEMRTSNAGVMDVLSLDALKLVVDEDQNSLNQSLAELIGKRVITPDMGSSLINDSLFAHDICMNLISAAQTLFVAGVHHPTQAAHDVVLDKSDLTQIGAQAGTETTNR
jgi:phosphate:Na+ symporter